MRVMGGGSRPRADITKARGSPRESSLAHTGVPEETLQAERVKHEAELSRAQGSQALFWSWWETAEAPWQGKGLGDFPLWEHTHSCC